MQQPETKFLEFSDLSYEDEDRVKVCKAEKYPDFVYGHSLGKCVVCWPSKYGEILLKYLRELYRVIFTFLELFWCFAVVLMLISLVLHHLMTL